MSYNFDGSDDRWEHQNAPAAWPTQSTIIMWIKPDTFSAIANLFCGYGSGGVHGMNIVNAGTNGALRWQYPFSTQVGRWQTADDTIDPSVWTGVAASYDASSDANDPIFYKKPEGGAIGTLSATETITPSGTVDHSMDGLWAGGVFGSFVYDGRIAYIRVFPSILTQAEIDAELEAAAAVLASPFIDLPYQADADDDSGNGRHGVTAGTNPTLDGADNPDIGGGAFTKSVAGTVTPTGALSELDLFLNSLQGTVTPAGSVLVQKLAATYSRSVGGAVTPVGSLSLIRIGGPVLLSLSGTVTPAGALFTVKNPSAGGGGSLLMRFLQPRSD
jgi:hypothetical protein